MAYKRFRTADLIASSPKDAIDKRGVHLLKMRQDNESAWVAQFEE